MEQLLAAHLLLAVQHPSWLRLRSSGCWQWCEQHANSLVEPPAVGLMQDKKGVRISEHVVVRQSMHAL